MNTCVDVAELGNEASCSIPKLSAGGKSVVCFLMF